MSPIVKILVVIASVWLSSVYGNPLFQGISFQKGFELKFTPFQRKPFSLIKEKWSPFGIFGSKRTISKREVESLDPIDEPPEIGKSLETNQIVHSVSAESAPAPVIEPFEPVSVQPPPLPDVVILPGGAGTLGTPTSQVPQATGGGGGLYTNIGQPGPANVFSNIRPPIVRPPIGRPPIARPPVVPPVTEPQPAPPVGPPQGTNTSITSGFASFIGNAFIQFLTQFFTNARLSLSRFGQ